MSFLKPKTIIAGPCSVETKDQLYNTTKELLQFSKIDILRAGVWKPRTTPGNFEGLGPKAFVWLKQIKEEFKLPIAIEVANRYQTEQALKNEIDLLWIGARTTVNPFSVQEIAETLKGYKIPVLIKNPISPDINLWSGAVERIANAGIEKIGLVHRGFTSTHQEFRYPPLWHLAMEMRSKYKNLPMICDPSHICGTRQHIKQVAQYALDLEMDGLMIESHHKPDEAWSDAEQQLTPKDLSQLLSSLKWKKRTKIFPKNSFALNSKRSEIEQLNMEIDKLVIKRNNLLSEIKSVKLVT